MFDKIIHLSVLSILIYERVTSIKWLKNIRHQFRNYNKVKDYFVLQRFVTYTSLGNNLSLLCSAFCLLFNTYPNDIFFILTWNTLFCITFGYWFLVFPNIIYNNEPKNYVVDFLAHGPALILYSYLSKYYNIDVNFFYVLYPISLGYFYLFFIWYPWYKLTNDTIYDAMDKNWMHRFFTILRMNFISLIGHIIYLYVF